MNLLVKVYLLSPISGEIPMFDALMEWAILNKKNIITKNEKLNYECQLPLEKYNEVWKCSDAIIKTPDLVQTNHIVSKFPSDDARLLKLDSRKSLLTASGAYKMRRKPLLAKLINCIAWFCEGDKVEIEKILKKINSIGKCRNIGYGRIDTFDVQQIENDYSIFAGNVLMKTVPIEYINENITGYRKAIGSCTPPYWHPDNYREVAIPC